MSEDGNKCVGIAEVLRVGLRKPRTRPYLKIFKQLQQIPLPPHCIKTGEGYCFPARLSAKRKAGS